MSLLDIAAEIDQENQTTAEPHCVIGKALRIVQRHEPDSLDTVKGWVAGGKTRPQVAEILSRFAARHDPTFPKVAPGSVGSHDRGECTCKRFGLA